MENKIVIGEFIVEVLRTVKIAKVVNTEEFVDLLEKEVSSDRVKICAPSGNAIEVQIHVLGAEHDDDTVSVFRFIYKDEMWALLYECQPLEINMFKKYYKAVLKEEETAKMDNVANNNMNDNNNVAIEETVKMDNNNVAANNQDFMAAFMNGQMAAMMAKQRGYKAAAVGCNATGTALDKVADAGQYVVDKIRVGAKVCHEKGAKFNAKAESIAEARAAQKN